MAKDDNLFEDVMKESSDLLDIGLDDLPGDASGEAEGEEADEGIIDLLDLVEKGDAELFSDELIEEDIITDEIVESSDKDKEILSDEKDALDDLLLDTDTSAPADDLGVNLAEDISDELLPDINLPEDSEKASSDTDIAGDVFDTLLDDAVLDELSEDSEQSPEDIEEFNLEPEDFSDLESVLEEGPISNEKITESPITSGVQGNLFSDFNTGASAPEDTHGLDDVLTTEPDIFGDELEKTFASSDDVTDEKSLWGIAVGDNTSDAETEGISILEEAPSDDEKIEYSGMDSDDPGFVAIDDIQLDSKSVDELFPDEAIIEGASGAFASDGFKQEESGEQLSSVIDQPETVPSMEPVVPELQDLADDKITPIEDVPSEIQATEEITPVEEVPPAPTETIVQPVISEEKIEEIVTKVVGEVVERVAREVFKEVAEKVISEAIEGLKKSLEAEL